MNAVTQIFAVLAGVIHIAVFALESLFFSHPAVQRIFLGRTRSTPEVRLFAFNQGFYNLFLAFGVIGGVAAGGVAGQAVALFCCGCITGAGVVLLASQRRMWRGALVQIVPAAVALLAALW